MSFIDFGTSIDSIETRKPSTFVPLPTGGHVMKILTSKMGVSKAGNPTWYLTLDVDGGDFDKFFAKYPIRSAIALHNEVGKQKAKSVIEAVMADNPGMIPDSVLKGSTFDPSLVEGLKIGAVIERPEKYYEIRFLCPMANLDRFPHVAVARTEKPKGAEATTSAPSTGEPALPF